MRIKPFVLNIAVFFLVGLPFFAQAEWHFHPGEDVYEVGPNESFTVEIILGGAGVDIDAFGFDFTFPHELLQYEDKDFAGTLLESWAFKDANEYSPGVLKVAGFNVAEKITPPAEGVWVRLNFTVKDVEGGSGELNIGNFGDDLLTDGSTSAPASFNVMLASVNITFDVTVPEGTPEPDLVYIVGTFNSWDPGPGNSEINEDMPLTKVGDNQWQITLPFAPGDNIEYKYTRGSWGTVEKTIAGEEIPNRVLVIPEDDHTQLDAVEKWNDIAVSVHQQDNNQIPTDYNLGQNYPNPFNPETTIGFDLPKTAMITLNVFDVTGKEITTLLNKELPAGRHSVKFNGKDLASGVYFVSLRAPDFFQYRKMLLLR